MKKLIFVLAVLFTFQVHAQPIQKVEQLVQSLTGRVGNIDTKVTRGFAGISNSIKELSEKIQASAANVSPLQNKPAFLSGDFFSPAILEKLNNAVQMVKEKISTEAAAFRSFAGADGKGSPGTQCFKFKSDMKASLGNIESLKGVLLGNNGRNPVGDKLDDLIQKLPPAALFPLYATLGSMITTLNQKTQVLSQNINILLPFMKETALLINDPQNNFTGTRAFTSHPDYKNVSYPLNDFSQAGNSSARYAFSTGKSQFSGLDNQPYNNSIDTTLRTIDLSKLCNVDRTKLGYAITAAREAIFLIKFLAKVLPTAEPLQTSVGASAIAEGTVTIKIDPGDKIGAVLDWLGESLDLLLDNASGNLDKCDFLNAQKIVADNQKILFEKIEALSHGETVK